MPSAEHETPIELTKLDPGLAVWLLTNLFDIKVPDYHHARAVATDVRVVVPRTYHADGMLMFCDPADQPVLAVVVEVQRAWDRRKRWTWRLYVAQLEAELAVNVALIVYCPDPGVARRYRDMCVSDGISLLLRPLIFTPGDVPLVIEAEAAEANPALAVLAALCHADQPDVDAAFPALAAALRSLGPSKGILYYDIVLAGLPEAPRIRWEAYMTTAVDSIYRSELFRELEARGKAEGKAEGEAKGITEGEARAVLTVLDARGIALSTDLRDRVRDCADLDQLDAWLRRAVTATTADDVFRD